MRAVNLGLILSLSGIVFILLGVSLWFGLRSAIHSALLQTFSPTDTTSASWRLFTDTTYTDGDLKGNPVRLTLEFLNVTNPAKVLAGEKPVLSSLATYTWVKNKRKINATLVNDKRQVVYNDFTRYTFVKDDSAKTKEDDLITMYNPFYGLVLQNIPGLPNEIGLHYALSYLGLATFMKAFNASTITAAPDSYQAQYGGSMNATSLLSIWFNSGSAVKNSSLLDPSLSKLDQLSNVGTLMGTVAVCGSLPDPSPTRTGCIANLSALYPTAQRILEAAFFPQLQGLVAFMGAVGRGVYKLYSTPGSPALLGATEMGPLVTKTAREWAFGKKEWLLSTLLQLTQDMPAADADIKSASLTGYFTNTTATPEAVAQLQNVQYSFETGRYNDSLMGHYRMYEGKSVIASYPAPALVTGSNALLNGFGLDCAKQLTVFVTQVERPLRLNCVEQGTFKGVSVHKYTLDPAELAPNPDYDVRFRGLFNITAISSGAPFALTKLNYLDVDTSLRLTETWGTPPPSAERDDTVILVEPTVGLTIKGNLRLMINVYVPVKGALFNLYNLAMWGTLPNATAPELIPLVLADENGVITDDDADKLKRVIKAIDIAPKAALGVPAAIGLVLLAIGLTMAFFGLKNEKQTALHAPHHETDQTEQPKLRSDHAAPHHTPVLVKDEF